MTSRARIFRLGECDSDSSAASRQVPRRSCRLHRPERL